MTKEITDADIEQAIKTCKWRMKVDGIDVCRGECNVCIRTIEAGKCDTLQNLFRKEENYGRQV